MRKVALILGVFIVLVASKVFAVDFPNHPLIEQAKAKAGERYQYAMDNNAQVELTSDGKSFYIVWLPPGKASLKECPIIVTLHGHGSWAFDEFYLWHKAALERGYAIVAIQWWLGQGERFQDYLIPQEIYRLIDQVFTKEQVPAQSVLFHGFSRGSANTYAVAALDRKTGKNYFALIVANAGKPGLDFPPNRDIEQGRFGANPLQGTHWVTFAGGQDPNPDRDGIEGMRQAAQWITQYGGVVDKAIEDSSAGHGGFHRNPVNMNAALDVFTKRLERGNS